LAWTLVRRPDDDGECVQTLCGVFFLGTRRCTLVRCRTRASAKVVLAGGGEGEGSAKREKRHADCSVAFCRAKASSRLPRSTTFVHQGKTSAPLFLPSHPPSRSLVRSSARFQVSRRERRFCSPPSFSQASYLARHRRTRACCSLHLLYFPPARRQLSPTAAHSPSHRWPFPSFSPSARSPFRAVGTPTREPWRQEISMEVPLSVLGAEVSRDSAAWSMSELFPATRALPGRLALPPGPVGRTWRMPAISAQHPPLQVTRTRHALANGHGQKAAANE